MSSPSESPPAWHGHFQVTGLPGATGPDPALPVVTRCQSEWQVEPGPDSDAGRRTRSLTPSRRLRTHSGCPGPGLPGSPGGPGPSPDSPVTECHWQAGPGRRRAQAQEEYSSFRIQISKLLPRPGRLLRYRTGRVTVVVIPSSVTPASPASQSEAPW